MGVSPIRFAVIASAVLACLMLGLLVGVRAGTSQSSHVLQVRDRDDHRRPAVDAAARAITETVTHTVTATAPAHTVTVPGDRHHGRPAGARPGSAQAAAQAGIPTTTAPVTIRGPAPARTAVAMAVATAATGRRLTPTLAVP